jgi:Mrp family chromosome partitioning ATPase
LSGSDSAWSRLHEAQFDRARAARERIVTVDRTDNAHIAFDMLRTKILKIMRENGWTSIAITSPTLGCGKTVVSLNLAFSLASLSACRTVLLDLDLRRPKVAKVLGTEQVGSMESFLKAEIPIEHYLVRLGDNLAVGANHQPVPFAAELLHRPNIGPRLAEVKERLRPDIMIFDLPPMLVSDDVLAFLPNVDCAMLVVAAEASTVAEIDVCERTLREASNVIGVVLNKCQYEPEKYGY